MPGFHRLEHIARQARQRECAFRRQHVADLLPCRLHEFVLVLPDHLGAPTRSKTVARLQTEIIQPVLADLVVIDRVPLGRIFAIDRRRECRHGVRLGRALIGQILPAVEHGLQILRVQGMRVRCIGLEIQRHHRTFEHGLVRCHTVEQEMIAVDCHRADADVLQLAEQGLIAGIARRRSEPPRQGFDIAHRASRELPVKVHGQFGVCRLRMIPGRRQGRILQGLAQAPQASRIERRHHAGNVVVARFQAARADQARDVALGILLEFGGQIRALLGEVRGTLASCRDRRHCLRVCPQPGFIEVGQFACRLCSGQRNRGQRLAGLDAGQCARHRAIDHHQHQPGAQMLIRIGFRWCQQPGKIRRIEINDRQIVRLEIGGVGFGIGAHHQALIDADDVARPVQGQVQIARHRGCGVAILLGLQGEADGHLGAHCKRGVGGVIVLVRACEASAGPGGEAVGDAHGETIDSLAPLAGRGWG